MRRSRGSADAAPAYASTLSEIFFAFLRLGLTSFGGPVAHLGFFNAEFVRRRRWLDDATYAQIVALCQVLPGPASSQVGMIVGLIRGGPLGAALAWIGFTIPSALALTLLGLGTVRFPSIIDAAWIHGVLVAAVAVVAVAVTGMYRTLCPDRPRQTIAIVTALSVLLLPLNGFVQVGLIVLGALCGQILRAVPAPPAKPVGIPVSRVAAVCSAIIFTGLLLTFTLVPMHDRPLAAFGAFYTCGALVFGGGHVVLPLLAARVVGPGWIAPDIFLAGYGAAQAIPGPLFTFAAYLGAAMHGPLRGISGAGVALVAIYLPSFLLIAAILPYWSDLAEIPAIVRGMYGVNAVVVGILLGALYSPVWLTAIHGSADVALLIAAFALLSVWKLPSWLVVAVSAAVAQIFPVH